MPDAWVADPWHVPLSPTTRQLLVELECSAHGVLLPAWSSSVCGGMSCLRRAQVGSTPQDYPQESLRGGGVSSYMVVQKQLTAINWLDSKSQVSWMVLHDTLLRQALVQKPSRLPSGWLERKQSAWTISQRWITHPSTPVLPKRALLSPSQKLPTMPAWSEGRCVSHWQKNVWGTCALQPCKHRAIPKKRGARDLSSTSPEPYRWNGKRVDWLSETPFVRQQSSEGFYLCLVLFVLSYP